VRCAHLELLQDFGHAMTCTAAVLGSDHPPTPQRSAVLRWVVAHVPLSDHAWNRMLAQLVQHGSLDDLRWLRRATHPDRLNLRHCWLLPLKSACAREHLLIIRFLCRILRAPPHANMQELELADSAQDVILECCQPYHSDVRCTRPVTQGPGEERAILKTILRAGIFAKRVPLPGMVVAGHNLPTECILQACNVSSDQANGWVHAARCASRWYNSECLSWWV
jgi:hypothetical protein